MEQISACIITFNEEASIERCLKSVAWCDEIVVVDSSSTDATVEIARRYTERVLLHPWEGHIAQKNFALARAVHNWVFCIDADEEVSTALRRHIEEIRDRIDHCDGYRVCRRSRYLNRWIDHSGWYPEWRLRLFRKDRGQWGGLDPHDKVILTGNTLDLPGDLLHYSFPTYQDHLHAMERYSTIGATHHRPGPFITLTMLGHSIWHFFKLYVWRAGFRDGIPGLIIAVTSAFSVFVKYAKVWERGLERKE